MVLDDHWTRKELTSCHDKSILKSTHVHRKEFYESEQTITKSMKTLRKLCKIYTFKNVYEFCAGHTFSSIYMTSRNYAKYATVYDIRFPKATYKLETYYPRLIPRIQYIQENIFTSQYSLEPNSLVFSIHPCRALAFRVAEIAIQNNLPAVIVPCCPGGSREISWLDAFPINNYDRHAMKVAEFLSSHGYDIKIKEINEKYTPRNKIIIGIP